VSDPEHDHIGDQFPHPEPADWAPCPGGQAAGFWNASVRKSPTKSGTPLVFKPLTTEDIAIITSARINENLPPEVDAILISITEDLSEFRSRAYSNYPTPKAITDQVKNIENTARKLISMIDECSTSNFMKLDDRLCQHIGIEDEHIGRRLSIVGDTIISLADAANKVHASRRMVKETKRSFTSALAGWVASMAHLLMPYGVRATESGPFLRLCTAVFTVGWRSSGPEKAIRCFVQDMRDEYVSRGLCLGVSANDSTRKKRMNQQVTAAVTAAEDKTFKPTTDASEPP
jgi:hypothetical protein